MSNEIRELSDAELNTVTGGDDPSPCLSMGLPLPSGIHVPECEEYKLKSALKGAVTGGATQGATGGAGKPA